MSVIYPYKWAGQFPGAEAIVVAKSEWMEGLDDLTLEQIRKGIARCRKEGGEFPPSIPEFRKLCLPTNEDIGILDEEEAYQQLCAKEYRHQLVKEISRCIDEYSWRMMSFKEGRKRFKVVYDLCVDRRMTEFREEQMNLLALEKIEEQEETKQLEHKKSASLQMPIQQKEKINAIH